MSAKQPSFNEIFRTQGLITNINGFGLEKKQVQVQKISYSKIIDLEYINDSEESVHDIVILELAQKIIKSGLVKIEEQTMIASKRKQLKVEINIVEPSVKFANLTNEVFKIGEEQFTEKELIEAVKSYYPERLV